MDLIGYFLYNRDKGLGLEWGANIVFNAQYLSLSPAALLFIANRKGIGTR